MTKRVRLNTEQLERQHQCHRAIANHPWLGLPLDQAKARIDQEVTTLAQARELLKAHAEALDLLLRRVEMKD